MKEAFVEKLFLGVALLSLALVNVGMAQSNIYAKANLEAHPINDIQSYINKRNENIWKASKVFTSKFRTNQHVKEGIEFNGNTVFVKGDRHPDLIPVHYVLWIFFQKLHFPDLTVSIQRDLVNKGFPASEMANLMAISYVGSFDGDDQFMTVAHHRIQSKYEMREKEVRSRADAVALIEAKERDYVFSKSKWAVKTLSQLTPPARRILLRFSFEDVSPGITIGIPAMPPGEAVVQKFMNTLEAEVEK